jgi:hypothetical protein
LTTTRKIIIIKEILYPTGSRPGDPFLSSVGGKRPWDGKEKGL